MCNIKSTVEKITLDPNEVLVIKISESWSEEKVRDVCDEIKAVLPNGARFLIMTGGIELKKIVC